MAVHVPRLPRVQFEHPVRVAALDGPPRIIRTLTANLSREGAFVRLAEPLGPGTRVALSLEAAGSAFPLVEGSVRWIRPSQPLLPGGFGMRFERYLHPRGLELVKSLVESLHLGLPLRPAPPRRRWVKLGLWGLGAAALSAGATAGLLAWQAPAPAAPPAPTALAAALEPALPASRPGPSPAPAAAPPEAPAAVVDAAPVPAPPGPVDGAPVAAPPAHADAAPLAAPPAHADAAPVAAPPAHADAAPVAALPVHADAAPVASPPATPAAPRHPVPSPAAPPSPAASQAHRSGASPAPARAAVARVPASEARGEIPLPTGAARALVWRQQGGTLRLEPVLRAGQVRRQFLLAGPPRAVFDLDGPAPAGSHATAGTGPHITRIRVGAQGSGTRVVVDLARAPRRAVEEGGAMVLEY